MAESKKKSNIIIVNRLRWNDLSKKLSDNDLLSIITTNHYSDLEERFKPYFNTPRQLFRDSPYKFYDRALEHAIEHSSAPLSSMFYLSYVVTLM